MAEAAAELTRTFGESADLVVEVDAIADQLCWAVDGDLDFNIDTKSDNQTVQKLSLLINFTLENARSAIAAEATARDRLSKELEMRQTLERELELKIAELREADLLRTVFLTNMHHELRTPMNAILGMSGILREMGQGANDAVRRFAQHLFDGAARLNDLIEQCLQFTNAADGGIELKAEEISAAMLVARAMRSSQRWISEAKLDVDVAPEHLSALLMVDPALIRRVLTNLISNAVKFAPMGGRIVIAGELQDDGFTFTIRDFRPGMREDEIASALKPFRQMSDGQISDGQFSDGQFSDGATRDHEGAGLGLAVSDAILRRHGGHLNLTPSDEGGLWARAWLPGNRIIDISG